MVINTALTAQYQQYVPDLNQPRFQIMKAQDAYQYGEAFKKSHQPPWLWGLYQHWRSLFREPYKGVTTDGTLKPGLFNLQDEGLPIEEIVARTNALLNLVNPEQSQKLMYHLDSPEWRTWSNPEFLLSDKGLRLDDHPDLIEPIMSILQASLSPAGYEKAVGAMRVNGFLGEIFEVPRVCNEFSYNFVLFGNPSVDRPWGYSFYGHHLCLNIFFHKRQLIISPWFTGAEPNEIDTGKYAGTRILQVEEDLGLKLMQSLDAEIQKRVQIYKLMKDPAMPWGRWNHDDQRHLCGAYRDNREVPYEGVTVSSMGSKQQEIVFGILDQFLLYLPDQSRRMKIEDVKKYLSETYFCWIGGYGDEDPFYYRIQSPVILVEFDHHSGVFLNNKEPAKFHVHTLLRTPNGGDYGWH